MSSTWEVHYDGRTLVIEQEMTRVSSMSEPDPNWKYMDRQGHEHYAVEEDPASGRTGYPTLEIVHGTPTWCSDCREEHEDSWWACRQCEQKIRPGSRSGRTRMIMGMRTYMIDDEPVSETAARDFVTGWQRELNARQGHDPMAPGVAAANRAARMFGELT